MPSEIAALTVYTDNYVPLFRRWADTLPAGFRPVVRRMDVDTNQAFGFRTPSWYAAIGFKLFFFVEYLSEQAADGEIVLCSDSDVCFFRKDTRGLADAALSAFASNPSLDMWIMREHNKEEVNGGLYFVRNSPQLRRFIEDARIACVSATLPFADQSFLNDEIRNRLVFDFIPTELVAWGDSVFDPACCLLHHAVCCATVAQKVAQQDRVLNKVGGDALPAAATA